MNQFVKKFSELYLKIMPYLLSFLIASILGPFLYCFSFYVHEGGHIAYGFFDNLISKGTVAKFEISNWIDCPFFEVLKLPQQTRIIYGHTSMNYFFGGIILTILIFAVFSYYFFKHSKNKYRLAVFLFPILFAVHEVFGNLLCGTDNLKGGPYQICAALPITDILVRPVPFLLIIPFFILLVPYIKGIFDGYSRRF